MIFETAIVGFVGISFKLSIFFPKAVLAMLPIFAAGMRGAGSQQFADNLQLAAELGSVV